MSAKEKNSKAESPERKPWFCLHNCMLAALLPSDQLGGPSDMKTGEPCMPQTLFRRKRVIC